MHSETIEKVLLLLVENQRAVDLTNKIGIFVLCIMFAVMVVTVYLAYSVKNDTIYIKRKLDETGD